MNMTANFEFPLPRTCLCMLADVKIQLRVPYCSLDTRQVHLDIYRPIDFVEHSVKLKSVDMPT